MRLLAAARVGDIAGAMSAVAEGAAIDTRDERGSTPLILASYYGHDALVKALLVAGASPNIGDAQRGNTALMGALFRGEDAVARILLDDARTLVDQRNHAGQTAVMFAALFGRTAMIEALAARGADFSLADAQGETAEGLAHKQGNDAVMEILAKYSVRR
ncbi:MULTISPECIES: ankyrin repeat domain-containing protein [unclassified Pseudoxanthomonas]|jgi:hypothetical protein|uniref:ankyrin repeat domain-containing protein n=1 Tax=unclassified Pseudoxanthomonas TaxID=2645906 RepID=UPI0030785590